MRKLFNIFALLSLAVGFTACEQTNPEPIDHQVSLTADKATITADGDESVQFTVKVDNKETTDDVQIILLNDNSVLTGTRFSTQTPGEYNFVAAYGTVTSEPVTITATPVEVIEVEVVLTADIVTFVAGSGDSATFTVTADGEDVTTSSTIVNVSTNEQLDGNAFTTDFAGDYTFKAIYGDYESNTQTIVVTAPVVEEKKLRIASDVNRIRANGEDIATLTVTYGEDDVTAESEIYVEQTGEILEDATFSTTAPATYTIRAKYNDMVSTYVTIDAYDPDLAEKYEVGSVIEVNGVKGMIFAIKGFPVYNDEYTEVIGTDQYCYIVSLDEEDLQWSTKYEWCNCIFQHGISNTTRPFDYFGLNIDDYPAFKWCMEHGEGWFLPSSTEMNWLWEMLTEGARDYTAPSVAKYNELIVENGGEPFVETFYWSSNETSEEYIEVIAFMNDSVVCLDPKKDNIYTARAAYRFKVE